MILSYIIFISRIIPEYLPHHQGDYQISPRDDNHTNTYLLVNRKTHHEVRIHFKLTHNLSLHIVLSKSRLSPSIHIYHFVYMCVIFVYSYVNRCCFNHSSITLRLWNPSKIRPGQWLMTSCDFTFKPYTNDGFSLYCGDQIWLRLESFCQIDPSLPIVVAISKYAEYIINSVNIMQLSIPSVWTCGSDDTKA